jgi:hypothetical protein
MAESETGTPRRLSRKIALRTGIIILSNLVLLIAARIALPYIVKSVDNKKLSGLPRYQGHAADVDMHIYRGAYSIKGLEVTKSNGAVPAPYFSRLRSHPEVIIRLSPSRQSQRERR